MQFTTAPAVDPRAPVGAGNGARRRPRSSKAAASSRIDASHLERYCFKADDEMLSDLTSLLSAVRAADRSSVRHHSIEWGRDLTVRVPVRNVSLWRSPEVREALVGALGYLTADRWSFKFIPHRRVKADPSQIHLVDSPSRARVFMPFSNGLDSYAIATELLAEANPPELVLVNVRPKDRPTDWTKLAGQKGQSMPSVQVACYGDDPHRAEPTFRSRPFLFDLLAGYGAAMAQPASVVIPENGQGSLGGSLVPLGSEAPHRSCHPGFTSRLSRLLHALTGQSVKFSHPALFRTKGEVLSALARREAETSRWLKQHRSCSYDARHSSQDGRVLHCGLCGNCMLRRSSLIWAEVDDSTRYRAVDLTASSLEKAFRGKEPRNFQASLDVARNSIRAMQRLAELTSATHRMRVESEVAAVSRGLDEPIPIVREKIMHFLSQHRREWEQFLKSCGAHSWVVDFAGA